MKNITILYEDELCIIINKPAGLAVQGGKGIKTSLDKILAEIRTPAPLLVHRLDKDTSGVLLAAKTREAAAQFSRLLGSDRDNSRSRQTVKQYIAVCAGCPAKPEGKITLDILIQSTLKKSETTYKVIKAGKLPLPEQSFLEYSVLELQLETGRTHQIRRHLSMTATPILGDDKYGDFALNKKLRKAIALKHMLLHASRLVIPEKNLDIRAPLPEYFISCV